MQVVLSVSNKIGKQFMIWNKIMRKWNISRLFELWKAVTELKLRKELIKCEQREEGGYWCS